MPPGMIDGPFSAPSSPPETPEPTKCRPCSAQRGLAPDRCRGSARCRRRRRCRPPRAAAPARRSRRRCGPPALTMMTILRGRSSDATKSVDRLRRRRSRPRRRARRSATRSWRTERLWTATVYPWRAKLRARLRPITASPVTPTPCEFCHSPKPSLLRLRRSSPARADAVWMPQRIGSASWPFGEPFVRAGGSSCTTGPWDTPCRRGPEDVRMLQPLGISDEAEAAYVALAPLSSASVDELSS